jgi:hypothetical protein
LQLEHRQPVLQDSRGQWWPQYMPACLMKREEPDFEAEQICLPC